MCEVVFSREGVKIIYMGGKELRQLSFSLRANTQDIGLSVTELMQITLRSELKGVEKTKRSGFRLGKDERNKR